MLPVAGDQFSLNAPSSAGEGQSCRVAGDIGQVRRALSPVGPSRDPRRRHKKHGRNPITLETVVMARMGSKVQTLDGYSPGISGFFCRRFETTKGNENRGSADLPCPGGSPDPIQNRVRKRAISPPASTLASPWARSMRPRPALSDILGLPPAVRRRAVRLQLHYRRCDINRPRRRELLAGRSGRYAHLYG
jgi:hypothetical protein